MNERIREVSGLILERLSTNFVLVVTTVVNRYLKYSDGFLYSWIALF